MRQKPLDPTGCLIQTDPLPERSTKVGVRIDRTIMKAQHLLGRITLQRPVYRGRIEVPETAVLPSGEIARARTGPRGRAAERMQERCKNEAARI
jgi:hypothetical protein